MSSLLFSSFFCCGLNQLIFPQKWCHVGLALICHFLVLDPHLKTMGPNLWLSFNRIALFHWTPDFGSSSKVAFSELCWNHKHITIAYRAVYEDTNWSWVHKKGTSSKSMPWQHPCSLGILLRSQSGDHP
jgi:hypothetical protein